MRWPGRIPAGEVTSGIAANIDLYPTFARLAGRRPCPPDRTIDGVDLWPLLSRRGAASPRDTFYYYAGEVFYKAEEGAPQNAPKLTAVRQGRWKLRFDSNALYDLQSDIGEKRDVSKWQTDVVDRLQSMARRFDKSLQAGVRPLGRIAAQR